MQVGDLCDVGVVAQLAVIGADRRPPSVGGHCDQHLGDLDRQLAADHEPDMTFLSAVDEPNHA